LVTLAVDAVTCSELFWDDVCLSAIDNAQDLLLHQEQLPPELLEVSKLP